MLLLLNWKMADDLERKLNGMTLTIECEEADDETIAEQLMLCLVGKLLTLNPFSIEAMKNTMKIAWRLGKGVVIQEIENKMFMFQFFSMSDKMKVLEEGPWFFDGAPLLFKEIEEGIQPSEIIFDTIRMWVKVEDVPLNKRTKSMVVSLASSMGKFVEFDDSGPIGWSKYMRFRVDLKLDKPFRRMTRIGTSNGSKLIKFIYEKLMDVCYSCGRLGHSYQQCLKYDDVTPVSELPYGLFLRSSPTKRRENINYRREEEIKVCQEFKGTLRQNKAKAKLNFDVGVRDLCFDDGNTTKKGCMQVYENPSASDGMGKVGSSIDVEVEAVGDLTNNSRFLKRGRMEPVVQTTNFNKCDKALIYDTPMLESTSDTHNAPFSYVNGGMTSINANDISAVIGGDQSRRTQ